MPLLTSEGAPPTREEPRDALAGGTPVEHLAIYRNRLRERTGRFGKPA